MAGEEGLVNVGSSLEIDLSTLKRNQLVVSVERIDGCKNIKLECTPYWLRPRSGDFSRFYKAPGDEDMNLALNSDEESDMSSDSEIQEPIVAGVDNNGDMSGCNVVGPESRDFESGFEEVIGVPYVERSPEKVIDIEREPIEGGSGVIREVVGTGDQEVEVGFENGVGPGDVGRSLEKVIDNEREPIEGGSGVIRESNCEGDVGGTEDQEMEVGFEGGIGLGDVVDEGGIREPEGVKEEDRAPRHDGDGGVGLELSGVSGAGYVEREYRPCLGEAAEAMVQESVGEEGMRIYVPLEYLSRDLHVEEARVKLAQMKMWVEEKRGQLVVVEDPCPYSVSGLRCKILHMLHEWEERMNTLFKEQKRLRRINYMLSYRILHVSHGEYAVNKGLHHAQVIIDDIRKVLEAIIDLIRIDSIDGLGRFVL